MMEQPAQIMKRGLAEVSVAFWIIKEILLILEQMLVKVHAAARFLKYGFGHKSNCFLTPGSGHLRGVLHQVDRIPCGH